MFKTRLIMGLVLASLIGNGVGDLHIGLYLTFFVLSEEQAGKLFSPGDMLAVCLVYLVGFIGAYLYMRPVDLYLGGKAEGAVEAPELHLKAKRRSLNYPVFAAGYWAVIWLGAAPFFNFLLYQSGARLEKTAILHLSSIVLLGGTVTVVFVYFLLDQAVRRWLVAGVFDEEPVSSQPEVYRTGIRAKFLLYYCAAMLMPMTIVGLSFYNDRLKSMTAAFATSDVIPLVFICCIWGAAIGLVFTILLNRDITRPIIELKNAMARVERGGLDVSVPVASTDEIGQVREGFNDMMRGLREREFIKETFGRYVTRQVRDAVLNGRLTLGGEAIEVTILLCDIREFTRLSDNLEPEEVVEFLNTYFSEMVEVIIETEGTLDKFIGDAFLAVYGAPLPMEDHTMRAAEAALKLRDALARYNERRAGEGREPVKVGVSVHTGKVVAGNIGCQDRMEYTVIGDAVNLASRIEGLNKQFNTDILISEAVYEKLRGRISACDLGPVMVRGKKEQVRVYGLDCLEGR